MSAGFRPATAGKVPGSGVLVRGHAQGDLWIAAGVALAVHALLFVALPVAMALTPAQAGQKPGVTSLEIALSAPPAAPARNSAPEPEPTKPAVEPEPEPEPEPLPVAPPESASPLSNPESRTRNQELGTRNQEPSAPSTGSSGAESAAWSHHNIRYPEKALEEGRTGAPVVRVEVLASGRAGRVELVESSGHPDLDEAAVNGLRTAWYRPATDGRRAVASVKLFQPRFVIENGRPKVR